MLKLTQTIISSNMSILNKLKQHHRFKTGSLTRPVTPSHLINDFININSSYEQQKINLSPHQKYLIQTKSMQRPFTGMFWAENQIGFYHCIVCSTRLFSFTNKFESRTGYATFWKGVENRVKIIQDQQPNVNFDHANYARNKANYEEQNYKRCQCAQCKSHIGVVYFDGPPPTFTRFSINSSLLKFQKLKDFEDPNIARKTKKQHKMANRVQYIR